MAATCERCGQVHTAGPWCENAQALHAAAVEATLGPGGVPMLPRAPVVLDGPAAPAALLPPGARRKHTPVPYLGPDPMPSRRLGIVVQVLTSFAAIVAGGQAMVLYSRMRIDERIARGDVLTTDTWEAKTTLLGGVGLARLAFVVAAAVAGLLWRRARRPKDVQVHYGEAYIELPLTWIVPLWVRLAPAVLVGLGVLVSGTVRPADPTRITFADQAALDRVACFQLVCWAVAFATLAYWPLLSERTHLLRRAWSEWYRERPGSVPYVPPVADRPTDVGRPEGIGWVLRTAGLVLLLMVGVIGVIAAVASLRSDPLPALLTLVVLGTLDVLVVQAFLRRRVPTAAVASSTDHLPPPPPPPPLTPPPSAPSVPPGAVTRF